MKGHVYKRGKRWSYLFDIEPDPLTGKRRQANGSGYKTEREAWKACRAAMADYVDGKVIQSDGKTENAQHVLALDPFTHAALKAHVELLDRERAEFGPDYQDHGVLFCWEDGRPPYPDTITRRFKQLAAAAGLPEIGLHDVRHSYATAGRDAKIDWKALSKRIGHADVVFTMKQYVQTDLEADRQVASTLAELIIGGSLASAQIMREDQGVRVGGDSGEQHERAPRLQIRLQTTCQSPSPCSETGSGLGSGGRI
jgi:integrase